MKSVEIKASVRANVGKKDAEALRAQGLVPSVLYGGEAPVHFSADSKSFKELVFTPDAYLVNLDVDGTAYQAILQDIQFHPVSDKILHADFLAVQAGEPITVQIPVKTVGNSVGVIAGGKLQTVLKKLKLKAVAENLPDVVKVDMTKIDLGGSVQVKDLPAMEGVEVLNVPNAVVARVQITRTARMAAAEAAK